VGDSEVVAVDLGNGQAMLVEARTDGDCNPERLVRAQGQISFDGVVDSIDAISTRIVDALRRAKPDKATVEFGLDVGVGASRLTSLLVKGSGTATIHVTMEWSPSRPSPPGS
jgi:Trypsin-co-occurring domain 1